jgi:acyl transferase domain-containing protein/NADPH:quinone reductase-like Zn-dependent oxidoreductase/NAD(P)-dependent dehydrogenase (short-subunit alcohol dehydrogenase family)/SAM-dependent methyltransferase
MAAFWRLLERGENAVTEGVPGSGMGRIGELYPDPEVQSDACRYGAFIEGIDMFDAEFFRISPVEAQLLDPQQRLMLETSWQALEDAGIDAERMKGSRTGVYIGISNMDYRSINLDSSQTAEAAASLYTVSGTSLNTAAGRVAFALGLEGPAMAVDTACSSSLVAVHQAVTALQRGEANMILAGGVQAILSGRLTELRANARMLSPDGQCKAFDASANGFVRGEGCGILVLKRLSDAEADGDRIWGVVLGSALNQDGTSAGFTVPSERAQAGVIVEALHRAGIAPSEVDYLEAHGTGTEVGDPIELNSAGAVYGEGRDPGRPLLVGSVKTNIGHLEPAAGVAGLIKVMLSMQHGLVPKHLHFRDPNPAVSWEKLPLKIASELTHWPFQPHRPPRAGISGYGWSGTNAHIVVEGYGEAVRNSEPGREISGPFGPYRNVAVSLPESGVGPTLSSDELASRPARLLPLSGKSGAGLRDLGKRYLAWLDTQESESSVNGSTAGEHLSDMAWTAAVGRGHFHHRTAVVFRDFTSLRAGLNRIAGAEPFSQPRQAQKVAFVYTGQGGQWLGMGEALYCSEPVARAVFDRCDRLIQRERGASLLDVMFGRPGAAGDLHDPAWTQPAIYALECALTALWGSVGIRPDVVLGHSLGEIAAAYAAGVYTLEEGLRFASTRGALMEALPRAGAMAAVFASERRVNVEVAEWNQTHRSADLCVAVDNGAHQVVSGPIKEVHGFCDRMEKAGVKVRRLRPSPAYHSPLVEPALDDLQAFFSDIPVSSSRLPLVSNVTGRTVGPDEVMDGAYWRRQAGEPVAFRTCVETLADLDVDAVIELGPHAVLGPLVSANWPHNPGNVEGPIVLSSLLRPSWDGSEPERADAFLKAVAGAYEAGLPISFEGLFAGEARRRVALPGYPFQRRRHWTPNSGRRRPKDSHPLLGVKHESPRGEVMFETEMSPSDPEWLNDHRVYGRVVMPGAFYGAMAASVVVFEGSAAAVVEDMQLHSPLVFSSQDAGRPAQSSGHQVQLVLDAPNENQLRHFEIFSKGLEEEQWTRHAEGQMALAPVELEAGDRTDLEALKAGLQTQDLPAYYRAKAATGIDFGRAFRSLEALWGRSGEAVGEVVLREAGEGIGPQIHPVLLDGCFQVLSAARGLAGIGTEATYLPFAWERLWLNGPLPQRLVCHARIREVKRTDIPDPGSSEQPETLTGDLWFYDPEGFPIGGLSGYTVKRATRSGFLSDSEGLEEILYEVVWPQRPLVGGLQSAQALVTPTEVRENMDTFGEYLSREGVAISDRARLLSDLERLSRSYSLSALEELGWRRRRGETVEPESLADLLRIKPEHTRLVGRLLRLLRDGGLLREAGAEGGYIVEADHDDPLPDRALADPESFADKMGEMYHHGHHELGLVRRSGAALAGGLVGTVDILEVLFRSEGPGVTEYYFAAPASRASNQLLADAVAQVVKDWPDGRPLRVIEVGAGTGSATSVVLGELPVTSDYLFTDISAGFFAEAEGRFADSPIKIEYRPLDIEKEPSAQGFEPHAYDLIIAANVLHATRDLGETLTNCLELLAPSGELIALENMRGRGWQDITFGLLDGWWRFADDCRPDHAMALPSVWRQALMDAGYDDVSFLGTEGVKKGGPFGSSVFIAQGPEEIAEPTGLWVLFPDAGDVSMQVARELVKRNQTVVLAESTRLSETPKCEGNIIRRAVVSDSRESWRMLFEELPEDFPLKGVLHLGALGRPGPQVSVSQLRDTTTDAGGSALALVQALLDADIAPGNGLWFATLGAQALERDYRRDSVGELAGAVLWGFGRAVQREAAHLGPRMLDIDPAGPSQITRLVDELMYPDGETQVAHRDGVRLAARLVRSGTFRTRLDLGEDSLWRLMPGVEGMLEGMNAEPVPRLPLGPGQVRVAVDAVGVNFLDVLLSMGVVTPAMPLLGEEFSGRIVETAPDVTELAAGERVVGLGFGTFSPQVVTQAELVAAAPEGISAAALATIPSAFVSAGLSFEMAELEPGDRVLIHTATGGVGLAAVQLAQASGWEIFATAGAPKQEYLRSLGIRFVFDSRTNDFGRQIREATGGEGVDMVLNSLTGPGFIEASLSCLADGGSFVEMGRRDIWSPEEMAESRPDVRYSILELDWLKKNEPAHPGRVLRDVMGRITAGSLKPLAHTRWPITEAPAAMDFMRAARHIGKNVLVMPPLAGGRLRPAGTYLVTGGLGGIGIEVARWLASHGAGVIVLNGRRRPDPPAEEAIEALRRQGADVRVELADVTNPAAVDRMLTRMDADLPPLAGVIHSVGVLSDGALGNQAWERFEKVLWPKVLGAWHLHRATSNRDLDLFILFSSITGVLGKSGQANHAAANTFLDQLAAYRRSLGLPGQAIAWGAWSELGEAEEQRARIERQLEASGTGWISPQQGLDAFDQLVRRDLTSSMVAAVDWPVFTANYEGSLNFFEDLLPGGLESEKGEEMPSDSTDVLSEFRQRAASDREGLLVSFLQRELQAVLRLPSPPAETVGFFDLGMDSLMSVEFRNRINRAFSGEYALSNTAVFDHPNLANLASHLLKDLTRAIAAEDADPIVEPPVPERPPQARADENDIAIVGMACRFPGAPDLSSFWGLLAAGENAVTDGRRDAGPWGGIFGDPAAEDVDYRRGAFVDGIDQFDAGFFRISPIEAQKMDPQQRMLLETSWQALEDAAIAPDQLRGSRTGVYAGVGSPEYRDVIAASGWSDSYLGTAASVAVGRVAFTLGLQGPALPVDMACASSLAAVHQAVAALQRGDVDLALAGGVNATLSQAFAKFHREIGMLSDRGRCSAFDASADGYVRGEGCGVVVLKRLSEAEADGDRIWAVIRGSAVSQNGASAALTVPNGPAQERLMTEVLAQAGVSGSEVDYLEAHAVGSQLGDPIELNAVAAVYGPDRDPDRPVLIGSVKSNIGHIEWAAGIAALIKTVLSMNHGVIPESLFLQTPNPNVEWDRTPVRVTSNRTDWPTVSGRRPLAGVNAFGLSGANAHVLLEGYRSPQAFTTMSNRSPMPTGSSKQIPVPTSELINGLPVSDQGLVERTIRLLPLSGQSPSALRDLAGRYLLWLDGEEGSASAAGLSDLAWTAGVGRSHFPHRCALLFRDARQLRERLGGGLVAADETPASETTQTPTRVALTHTSRDRWWVGMGEGLYRREPVARAVLDRCDALFGQDRGVSLLDVLFGDPETEQDPVDRGWVLPASYALGCALTAQWASVGIRPGAVMGRGPGMLAAARAAGVFSLEEGLRLAVALGDGTGLTEDGAARRASLETAVSDVNFSPPSISLVNGVTGRLVESVGALDIDVWLRQDEESVDALEGAETLARLGVDALVEIGPDRAQVQNCGDIWPAVTRTPVVINTLTRPSVETMESESGGGFYRAVANAYEAGLGISFAGLFAGEARRRISIPTYAFQRNRHWI